MQWRLSCSVSLNYKVLFILTVDVIVRTPTINIVIINIINLPGNIWLQNSKNLNSYPIIKHATADFAFSVLAPC